MTMEDDATNGFNFLVEITRRIHPFPSRTRQLSFSVPRILGWKRPGKVGLRQIYIKALCLNSTGLCLWCAQHGRNLAGESPEHALVVGSV